MNELPISREQLLELGWKVLRKAAWAPLCVVGLHGLLSRVLGLYGPYPELDVPMHFVGGLAMAHFLGHALAAAHGKGLLGRPSRGLLNLAWLTSASTVTILWEFLEFTTDHLGLTHAQAGVADTMLDFLMGMLGGLLYLACTGWKLPTSNLPARRDVGAL